MFPIIFTVRTSLPVSWAEISRRRFSSQEHTWLEHNDRGDRIRLPHFKPSSSASASPV